MVIAADRQNREVADLADYRRPDISGPGKSCSETNCSMQGFINQDYLYCLYQVASIDASWGVLALLVCNSEPLMQVMTNLIRV